MCPFFECEKISQLDSGSSVEAIASDGRSTDLNSRTVWLQVYFDGSQTGWLFISPDRVDVPEGLLDRLPVAAWNAPTPAPTPTGDPAFYLKTLCDHNVYEMGMNPNLGKTLRFKTPIKIDTQGIYLIEEAVRNIERLTNGLVTFEIVDYEPEVGIIVSEGSVYYTPDSRGNAGNAACSCGSVSPNRFPSSAFEDNMLSVDDDGYINTRRFFNYGGSNCDLIGCNFPNGMNLSKTSMEEHELAHAIGLGKHFPEFTGYEGFSYNVNLVASALYSLPAGTDMAETCAAFQPDCPAGVGPGGITTGFYDPLHIDDDQRRWLWKSFGHAGLPMGEYGGEMCNGGTPYTPVNNGSDSNNPFTFGSPVNHPCTSISVDGISSDWLDIPPLTTDAQDSGPYDFAALYACSDENNLYFRIDPHGSFTTSVPVHFAFDMVARGENLLVFQAGTSPNDFVNVGFVPMLDNAPQFNLQKQYRGTALAQVFEMVIPLQYLGYPDTVTIHAYANDGVNPMPEYDSFAPVEYTLKPAAATVAPTVTP